ncbi:helix-turn-helix transcriptional regulator [Ferrimonas lipolytica]|uniref:Helix-turn-helix transcriptional regulator n=1 Tax=Ferrimonas lipolytica TaxID=2724191 RepID=A0A6H1UB36_9GAMM|nr:helix-turn-helix transcriptional regulator [Ferrimonas lipolytica]QIZ76254.1 helix-turn-helix transcriptional regulator [Ferrimonas lipolytica]
MKPFDWVLLKLDETCLEHVLITSERDQINQNSLFNSFLSSSEKLKVLAAKLLLNKPLNAADTRLLGVDKILEFELQQESVVVGRLVLFTYGSSPAQASAGWAKTALEQARQMTNLPSEHKDKTKSIVLLTAMGFNSQEISNAINMTTRGVDYHIETAKRLLGASTKANLVFKASQQGWFTAT